MTWRTLPQPLMETSRRAAGARTTSQRLACVGVTYLTYSWISYGRAGPAACPWRLISGHSCPLCGLSTGVALSLRGSVGPGFRTHPFSLPVIGAVVGLIALSVWEVSPWELR